MSKFVRAINDEIQNDKGIINDKPDIRVWCHPHHIGQDGEDYYKTFKNVQEANDFIRNHKEAEKRPLFAFNGYEFDLMEPLDLKEGTNGK